MQCYSFGCFHIPYSSQQMRNVRVLKLGCACISFHLKWHKLSGVGGRQWTHKLHACHMRATLHQVMLSKDTVSVHLRNQTALDRQMTRHKTLRQHIHLLFFVSPVNVGQPPFECTK